MEEEPLQLLPFQPKDLKQLKNSLFLSDLLSFSQQPAKIKYLSLAYGNTMVCAKTFQNRDYLLHLDQKTQILWMRPLPRLLNEFAMPTDREVVVLNMAESELLVFNLQKKTANTNIFNKDITNIEVHVFCQSKVVSITGRSFGNLSLISYTFENSFQERQEIIDQDMGLYPQQAIKKMNNHSKLGWVREYHPEQQVFFSFSSLDAQLHLVRKDIRVSLNTPRYMIESVSLICQSTENHFLVKVLTHSKTESEKQFDRKAKFRYVLCQLTEDSIKEEYFLHKGHPTDFSAMEPMLCYGMGSLLVMVMTTHKNEGILMFVNPRSKEVLSVTEKAKGYLLYSFPQWSSDILIERWNKQDPNNVHLRTIYCSLPPLKDIFLHWLLDVEEDFDDDLLYDAVDSLVDL